MSSATATSIISEIASSTGALIESSFPLFWWVIGFFFAMFAIMLISGVAIRAVKIIKGRRL